MAGVIKKTEVVYFREPHKNESNKLRLVKIIIMSVGLVGFLLFSKMFVDVLDEDGLGFGLYDIGLALFEWAGSFIAE